MITSGGGFSSYYSRPNWQEKAVADYFASLSNSQQPQPGFNQTNRGYPDVTLIGTAYEVVIAGNTVVIVFNLN